MTKANWQYYDCIDGCGAEIYAARPSRCVKCREKYWSNKMGKPGRPRERNYKKVLLFIANFKKKNSGISPSVREIMDGCELYSTSTTSHILDVLEDEGKIERISGARSIKLVGEKYYPPSEFR